MFIDLNTSDQNINITIRETVLFANDMLNKLFNSFEISKKGCKFEFDIFN